MLYFNLNTLRFGEFKILKETQCDVKTIKN